MLRINLVNFYGVYYYKYALAKVCGIQCYISILCFIQIISVLDARGIWIEENLDNNSLLTNTWSVKLVFSPEDSITQLNLKANNAATSFGMTNLGQVGELIGHYLFVLNNNIDTKLRMLGTHSGIEWYDQQSLLTRVKRYPSALLNTNKKITPVFSDPLYPEQWHLHNSQQRIDCNVTNVWVNNITGLGIVVAVVDDGVQWNHPDLVENYCAEGSFDLNSDDDDPTPVPDAKDENKHGTRCAGEIAAVSNSVCGVGIAYQAKFSGIRILDGPMTDSMEATAFNKHFHVNDIYSCSWGPEDDGKTVDGPHLLAQAALKHGIVAGRNGFGSIFIVASGNGGSEGDNCNYDGYANSIYTVTIGAIDEFGYQPPYAEQCTSMLACTVSSGQLPARGIVTTDWTLGHDNDQCTKKHSGTSAATPLAAGMIALMLQAQPCLCWRDVQHIVAITAIPLYEITSANQNKKFWTKNAAGYVHNNYHGFGLLDAWRLVNAAKVWKKVPWLTSFKPVCLDANVVIPNDSSASLVVETTVSNSDSKKYLLETLEHILITVTISHSLRGNLKFIFICPSRTRSVIPPRRRDISSEGLTEWTFSTVKCWGENPVGKYQLMIMDIGKAKNSIGTSVKPGVLKKWKITLYGSQMRSDEILQRKKLVKQAFSGKFMHSNFTVSCPLGRNYSYDLTEALSERTLKLLVALSCFFVFWSIYYSIEMIWCNDEEKDSDRMNDAKVQSSLKKATNAIMLESYAGNCNHSLRNDDTNEENLLLSENYP